MSDGVSSSPQFDLQTNVLLKIPSCGPPKIFFQMSAAACSKPCPLASVYLLNLTGEQWIRFHRTNFRSNPKGLVAYDLLLEPNFYIGNCKLFCLESFSLTNLMTEKAKGDHVRWRQFISWIWPDSMLLEQRTLPLQLPADPMRCCFSLSPQTDQPKATLFL